MKTRRPLGRILVDGGFISDQNLYHALHEQPKTIELIGGVLVKMDILDASEINAVSPCRISSAGTNENSLSQ